jgi:hypothetical protein
VEELTRAKDAEIKKWKAAATKRDAHLAERERNLADKKAEKARLEAAEAYGAEI